MGTGVWKKGRQRLRVPRATLSRVSARGHTVHVVSFGGTVWKLLLEEPPRSAGNPGNARRVCRRAGQPAGPFAQQPPPEAPLGAGGLRLVVHRVTGNRDGR